MAIQTINVGSAANSGGGDPLRLAMIKINENFTEVYGDVANLKIVTGTSGATGGTLAVNAVQGDLIGQDSSIIVDSSNNTVKGDFIGSVFADDSTVLIDGVGGTINAGALTGALPAIDGSALTGITVSGIAFSAVTGTPTTLSGYGIADAYTQTQVDTAISNATSSIVIPAGSSQSIDVVAADSTLLVDSVNGTLNATTLTGALPAIDGSSLTGITTAFSNITSTPTTLAGYGITDAITAGGDLEGNLSGSVFADDSTVLVDGVNGTLNSSALTKPIALADNEKITFGTDDDLEIFHNSSNGNTIIENNTGNLVIKGSNLFLQSASSEYFFRGVANGAVTIYHDNVAKFETTTDGISVTDHIALPDSGELRLGTDNDMQILHSGANGFVKSTTGSLVLQGSTVRIQDAGSSQTAFSASNGIATLLFENTAVLNTTAGGIQIEQGVEEKFATLTGSTGVVAHDYDNGHVFYHKGGSGDITANFTNLGLTAEYGTNLTVIINQGATPYEVTAVQIGGAAQTINWQGGSAPTGNANGIDSFSFTILNDGGTYVVLGQMVDFT